MRSYRQYCGLAKALDVIGDRWTLLIVRELLIRDRCRYTDLRDGLPGIATNLLADRLRELERAGIEIRGRSRGSAPRNSGAAARTSRFVISNHFTALRNSCRWAARTEVVPALIVGSVNTTGPNPSEVRACVSAVRIS